MMAAASPRRAARLVLRARGTPLSDLSVGDVFDGTVSRVSPIGIWVEIGAEKEALLPASQLQEPKASYKKGAKISGLKIFEVSAGDTPATRKIRVTTRTLVTDIEVGQTCSGKVTRVSTFGVFFDIGAVTDVLGPKSLIGDATYNQGDTVEVKVVKVEGDKISVSTDMEATPPAKGRPEGVASLKIGEEVSGTISQVNETFGLFINIGFKRDALFRRNQLEKPLSAYKVGDKIEGLRVVAVNVDKEQVEVSQRRLPQDVKTGDPLEGTVTKVMTFGVFFDAGLAGDVLAPTRQLKMEEPSAYKSGVVVDLVVVKVEGDRVTVTDKSEKELGTPLADLVRGTIVEGTVSRITGTGAFIDIGATRDALLRKPPEGLEAKENIGDLIITKVDVENDLLEVNMLDALASEEQPRPLSDFSIGAEVDGTVSRVSDFGLFVDIGATRDALLRIGELGSASKYKEGDKIKGLKVSDVDPAKSRLAVSLRPTAANFEVGDEVDGTVTKIQAFGIFVDIGASADALLPKRLLEKEPSEYNVGEELKSLKVVTVDPVNNRLSVGQADSRAGDDQAGRISYDDLQVGATIEGVVRNLQDYGVFVDIGLFRRDALLPLSQFGEKNIEDFKVDQKVELYIYEVQKKANKVTLSVNRPDAMYAARGDKETWIPKGDMLPDAKYFAWRWGEEILDEEPIPWKEWETKYPGLVAFAEKETEVLFSMQALGFWCKYQIAQSEIHWLPTPVHLRREDAGLPEIPETTFDDYKMGWEHLGLPLKVSVKYRQPPFNNPNWVMRNKNWDWEKLEEYKQKLAKENGEAEPGEEGREGEEVEEGEGGALPEPEPAEP